jgi:hypothetical protein
LIFPGRGSFSKAAARPSMESGGASGNDSNIGLETVLRNQKNRAPHHRRANRSQLSPRYQLLPEETSEHNPRPQRPWKSLKIDPDATRTAKPSDHNHRCQPTPRALLGRWLTCPSRVQSQWACGLRSSRYSTARACSSLSVLLQLVLLQLVSI